MKTGKSAYLRRKEKADILITIGKPGEKEKFMEIQMKRIRNCAFIVVLLIFLLSGSMREAYLRVEILSKDEEELTLTVRVVDFGAYPDVTKGRIPVGTEGEIDCSNLMITGPLMFFIMEGSERIVSYVDTGQTDFPITIYSLENTHYFDERMESHTK